MKITQLLISALMISGLSVLQSCNNPVTQKNTTGSSTHDHFLEAPAQEPNTLSDQEKTEGWVLLFDGQTIKEWRGFHKDTFPGNRWDITNTSLHCIGVKTDDHIISEDIISKKKYKNFELSVEWKIDRGGVSGIYFLAVENSDDLALWKSALKMQLTDNENNDSDRGKNGERKSGSLFDILPPEVQNTKIPGEWNQVRIIVSEGRVEFFQNSEKIMEFELWNDDWEKLINKSKYKTFTNILNIGGTDKDGYIGFQDCKKDIWFRNIKIRSME